MWDLNFLTDLNSEKSAWEYCARLKFASFYYEKGILITVEITNLYIKIINNNINT